MTFEVIADETQNTIKDTSYFVQGHKELQQIAGLFLACRGQYGRFLFTLPTDHTRENQHIATTNGIDRSYRLMRTWKTWFIEPVGAINLDETVVVYLDAIGVTPGDYSFSDDGTHLVFDSIPAADQIITMSYSYYYRCRFIEDIQDFEQFMRRLWTLGACKFRSVKQGVAYQAP